MKMSPLEYMLSVMNDRTAEATRRDRMAQAAAPFVHARAGEATKKVDAADKAKRVAAGRFAPSAAPQLVVNNR
jgi:phage terminase small subunit